MCRDLCFHVQEHRYSLIQIKDLIASFNLKFLGFVIDPETKKKYIKRFHEDNLHLDLNNWSKYEKDNPNTFKAMYQFWLNRLV